MIAYFFYAIQALYDQGVFPSGRFAPKRDISP